jgi:hypothetical protein
MKELQDTWIDLKITGNPKGLDAKQPRVSSSSRQRCEQGGVAACPAKSPALRRSRSSGAARNGKRRSIGSQGCAMCSPRVEIDGRRRISRRGGRWLCSGDGWRCSLVHGRHFDGGSRGDDEVRARAHAQAGRRPAWLPRLLADGPHAGLAAACGNGSERVGPTGSAR